ncbi:hypothetical protein HDU80_000816, partial [Chytriomyces hyalinus]
MSSNRAATFKNRSMMKADELRRRREDVAVEIRKAKKEDSLAKRRNMAAAVADEDADSDSDNDNAEMPGDATAAFALQ